MYGLADIKRMNDRVAAGTMKLDEAISILIDKFKDVPKEQMAAALINAASRIHNGK